MFLAWLTFLHHLMTHSLQVWKHFIVSEIRIVLKYCNECRKKGPVINEFSIYYAACDWFVRTRNTCSHYWYGLIYFSFPFNVNGSEYSFSSWKHRYSKNGCYEYLICIAHGYAPDMPQYVLDTSNKYPRAHTHTLYTHSEDTIPQSNHKVRISKSQH